MNEDVEKAVGELEAMLPGIAGKDRANDYELLMALGFTPLPPHGSCGAFFEWHREVKTKDDSLDVNVCLFESAAQAYVRSRSFNVFGKGDAKTAGEALRQAFEIAGFKGGKCQ